MGARMIAMQLLAAQISLSPTPMSFTSVRMNCNAPRYPAMRGGRKSPTQGRSIWAADSPMLIPMDKR
jgi:hypothetical protein